MTGERERLVAATDEWIAALEAYCEAIPEEIEREKARALSRLITATLKVVIERLPPIDAIEDAI